jgi:dipeptidyl aminopeptidase/acylaminoacyl peptidase
MTSDARFRVLRVFFGSLQLGVLLLLSDAGLAETADVYARLPIMVAPSLSPDGKRVAFLSEQEGRYHIVIEQISPEFRRHIVKPADDLDFDWVHWANDERLLFASSFASMRSATETEETRLFSIKANGKDMKVIMLPATESVIGSRVPRDLPPPQVQDRIIDWLPEHPNHILVAVDADFDGYDEIRRIDIRNGRYTIELKDYGGSQYWMSDRSGELRLGWTHKNDKLTVAVKQEEGTWPEVQDSEWLQQNFVPVAFVADNDTVLAMGPNAKGIDIVREINLATHTFGDTLFEHDSVDANSIVLDSHTGVPVGIEFIEHRPAVHYIDDELRQLQAAIDRALPDSTNRIVSTSANRRQLFILASSATDAGTYWLLDRDHGELGPYSAHIEGLTAEHLSPVRPVSYAARDGLTIPAYLTLPVGVEARNLPTVVLPHGGPRARDSMDYDFLSQYLASLGYAVLQPNFRGSSGYGNAFATAGLGEWGGLMQDDVTDGANWLIEESIADANRICIVGWSYGGYAAAMGAIKTPSLYRCAASINGVLDLPRQILDERAYQGGRDWTRHMGLEGESAKVVSPYHQADRITVPILVVQVEDDTRVHKEQGRRMAKRLQQLDKPFEYLELESGGHSIRNVDGRQRVLDTLKSFLAQHLGNTS